MFMWWPRLIPYIGTAWVFCTRYGDIFDGVTDWEVKVFILSWLDYTLIVYQYDVPRWCGDDECN